MKDNGVFSFHIFLGNHKEYGSDVYAKKTIVN